MEAEMREGPSIKLQSHELKKLRIGYVEEAEERDCYNKELSEKMMRNAAKATKRDTIVELQAGPREMLEVVRLFRLYVEYKESINNHELYEKYNCIYETVEKQLIAQGLTIR